MEQVLQRFSSHEEAEQADRDGYRRLTPSQRLMMSLELHRMWLGEEEATEQRLARVLTRAELPQR